MTAGASRSAVIGSERLPVAVCVEEAPLRDRVCAALSAGGHAVFARDATIEGVLASCNGTAPACVVLAANRPDPSTIDTVRSIHSRFEHASAVLVCQRATTTEVRRALELGIDGVVLKDDAEQALVAVVAAVCAGQVSVPSGQRAAKGQALTTREKQILALVVAGLTNAQIAGTLFLAESTVKSHLSSAFGKLGVSSRYEATAVILDPERGRGLGIREIRSDPALTTAAYPRLSPAPKTQRSRT
jgi:DNA-binding NarL/FixJ family response regulator